MTIYNFGSLNVDKTYYVESLAKPGETVDVKNMIVSPGGKGLNQSVAIARAGGDVYHVGAVGEDGGFLVDYLEENGVCVKYIKKLSGHSGQALVQVDDKGQNSILIDKASNSKLEREHVDKALKDTQKGDIVIIQNEINNIPYIMRKARERQLMIVFNPSPMDSELKEYPLSLVDIFVLNELEGAQLADTERESEVIGRLEQKFPEASFVLTLGNRGSVYKSKDEYIKQGVYGSECIDSTGAGDTFTGYFVYAISKGKTAAYAMELASVASMITISRPGAAVSIPAMSEVSEAWKLLSLAD